jgi:hypothetical protein
MAITSRSLQLLLLFFSFGSQPCGGIRCH